MKDRIESEQRQKILGYLESGKKIEAIKFVRELTGSGLKEAKKYVDEIAAELIERNPEKYSKLASTGSGCRSTALFLLLVSFGGIFLLINLIF